MNYNPLKIIVSYFNKVNLFLIVVFYQNISYITNKPS